MGEKQGQPNNARLIAELQAVTLGIHLVGLDRLPEVMTANRSAVCREDSPANSASPAEAGSNGYAASVLASTEGLK